MKVPPVAADSPVTPPETEFLEEVCPPPCLVLHFLAQCSTPSHHLSLALLVLEACNELLPPELHKTSPPVGVPAVIPAPPLLVSHVLPASSPPLLVASDASPSASKEPGSAMIVLHAPGMSDGTKLTVVSAPLSPESKTLQANSTHLPEASHTLLVRFHPLGPAFLVAPTGIKLPACSSTPLVVTTGATPTTHAVDKPATAVLVRLSASLSGLVPVCSTSPKRHHWPAFLACL